MGIINLNKLVVVLALSLSLTLSLFPNPTSAQLSTSFYQKSCPNVEAIVKKAVDDKVKKTFVTIPATLRLFFHDCIVSGCDASTMISLPGGNAEKDSEENKSLAGDGFDTVIKAKQAVEAKCPGKVSCADILALAARDVVVAAGGKWFPVEMGRLDGKTSSASSVNGKLPKPTMNADQLTALFKANGLSQQDMIALSGAHTLGFSHCSHVIKRYDTNSKTVNATYLSQLKQMCPRNVDERIAINMDPTTPRIFDNVYYKNLQQRKGLFTSDQDLWENPKTRGIVDNWAKDANAFNTAFALAMKNLGRVGVKTSKTVGNIRIKCDRFN